MRRRFPVSAFLEYHKYEDKGLIPAGDCHPLKPTIRTLNSGRHSLWDGLVILLANEVARATSDADIKAAVSGSVMMLGMTDEAWGQLMLALWGSHA